MTGPFDTNKAGKHYETVFDDPYLRKQRRLTTRPPACCDDDDFDPAIHVCCGGVGCLCDYDKEQS